VGTDPIQAAQDYRAAERAAESDGWALAQHHTLRTIRAHPELSAWLAAHGSAGEDSYHAKVVTRWLRAIRADTGSPRRDTNRAEALLEWAEDFLTEEQPRMLAETWNAVVRSPAWAALSPAGKWLYRAIHALAREQDRVGGVAVLLSNRAALSAFVILGGPRYRSLTPVTQAREELVRVGLVTAVVGQAWITGKRATATRYTITTRELVEQVSSELMCHHDHKELALPPTGDSSLGSWECVPSFDRDQRGELSAVFGELRKTRAEPGASVTAEPAPGEPEKTDPEWYADLLSSVSDAVPVGAGRPISDAARRQWDLVYASL